MNQVLVAGTAGGVGTTTVVASLFGAWAGRAGAPRLGDHTAGTLGRRLAEGDEMGRLDENTVLVDAGPHAYAVADELTDASTRLVVVTAATPLGCELAADCLGRVRAVAGDDGLARTVLAVVGVQGRHRIKDRVLAIASDHQQLGGWVVLDADSALAAGGRIPWTRLGRRSRQAIEELAALCADRRPVPGARVSG